MVLYNAILFLLYYAKLPKLCDALGHKKAQLSKSKGNVDKKKLFKIMRSLSPPLLRSHVHNYIRKTELSP